MLPNKYKQTQANKKFFLVSNWFDIVSKRFKLGLYYPLPIRFSLKDFIKLKIVGLLCFLFCFKST